ncbi:hypothetical protein B0I37DRAFT_72760 [Chaetomium sp. MPI-CAGE-AT-0009]|nr:hypothetical protein B0I37DRAFT_72760 [Chaetomium sp. MPI-CAGE-AT-0009]
MVGFRQIRVLPAALVALILVSSSSAADAVVDFSFYPAPAQDCLYAAADSSKCKSQTVPATNACFCRNGGDFITTAAACIGQSSRGNLRTVYRTMRDACDTSETPINITEGEFMEAAEGSASTTLSTSTQASSTTSATSATTTNTGTVTSTALPTSPEEEQESGALSTGALVGIIVGAIGGLAMLGGLGYYLFRRGKKVGEESHPMLPQQGHVSMAPSGHESTAYYKYGSPPDTGGWPKNDWNGSPDPRISGLTTGFNWESPAHLAYPGAALAPSPPLPIQELDGAQQFRPGSTEAPVEMGGTPVVTTPPLANSQYQPYNSGQQYPGHGGWNQPQP